MRVVSGLLRHVVAKDIAIESTSFAHRVTTMHSGLEHFLHRENIMLKLPLAQALSINGALAHDNVESKTVAADKTGQERVPTGYLPHDHATRATGARTTKAPEPETQHEKPYRIDRGLTNVASTGQIRQAIRLRALSAANRFRVIRTFDVAAICFPERPYKAALTAAQRAMRSMVKDNLLIRYRTDRQQHVYGLTQKGAQWLDDRGVDASSSVRRVSDMTNPEHLLWSNFIVTCCEVRGLSALTETELMKSLNRNTGKGEPVSQGLITVNILKGNGSKKRILRPDAIAYEKPTSPGGKSTVTWFEIDRSKRGADREACLTALFRAVGRQLQNGHVLGTVVVLTKSERILKRAMSLAQELVNDPGELKFSTQGTRILKESSTGVFEVWTEIIKKFGSDRTGLEPALVGHVIIQMLPLWLPKVRIDNRRQYSTAGWFSEDYLPYRRPAGQSPWPVPTSPLL
ncbi:replication-relaxation family protein [Eoetvoesiella caeni]|nr:replication-relaxation family protein [Eoetvoesiella caeni]